MRGFAELAFRFPEMNIAAFEKRILRINDERYWRINLPSIEMKALASRSL